MESLKRKKESPLAERLTSVQVMELLASGRGVKCVVPQSNALHLFVDGEYLYAPLCKDKALRLKIGRHGKYLVAPQEDYVLSR